MAHNLSVRQFTHPKRQTRNPEQFAISLHAQWNVQTL